MHIGVALGGGGAKGLAHVGALRVIESAGIQPTIVTGTSAGALVAALYAAGKTPDDITQIARRWTLWQFLTLDYSGNGLCTTDGIRQVIETEIGADTRIENLPRRFACVAVDLETQSEVVFETGKVSEAVCASAAFPGFFSPVRVNGRELIDGGVLNPVPCDVARKLGAVRVIAVDLKADEPVFTTAGMRPNNRDLLLGAIAVTTEKNKIVRAMARAIGVMSKHVRECKLESSPPDVIIRPAVQEVGLLDFSLAEESLAAGESAARTHLAQIQALTAPPPQNWRTRTLKWMKWK